MARPASRHRREVDPVPLEGLRFEDVRLKGVETREELKARVARDSQEVAHRVWRDSILFGIVSTGVAIVSLTCLWIVVKPDQTPDQQKWATTLLTTIVSAGVGYLTGKSSKSA
jgi:hypothetical protein